MDLSILTSRVHASRLLTDGEKQYWANNLSRMNPSQLQRLDGILTQSEQITWDDRANKCLSILTVSAV